MRHLDLFSGIGGFALAVDAVWGKENVEHIFCEIDPFCKALLAKRFEGSVIYGSPPARGRGLKHSGSPR